MAAIDYAGFDWDDRNRAKCQKHGLAIVEIEHVIAHGETMILPVIGLEESRFIGIGLTLEGRRAFVVFTIRERDGNRLARPISARYMHQREAKKYDQAFAGLQKR